MTQINIHAAKTNMAKLVDRALEGEEIVIAKHGKPLVKLVPVVVPKSGRRLVGLDEIPELSEDAPRGRKFLEQSLAPIPEEEFGDWLGEKKVKKKSKVQGK